MKCPKCGDELMNTSRGNLCLNCGYNEFANNNTPPENAIKAQAPVRSPVTTTVAPQTAQVPAPVAPVQTVPAAVQPAATQSPAKAAEIWFKSFNPVSAYIEDERLRMLYAKVNIGWYPIAGPGWLVLSALLLIPTLSLLFFGRLAALGVLAALIATYYFMLSERFGSLTIPWKVQLAQLQPAQNSSWVTSGQLFFRVITALLAGLLFILSFGNLGMLLTVPLLLLTTALLCIEIYEFIKQV